MVAQAPFLQPEVNVKIVTPGRPDQMVSLRKQFGMLHHQLGNPARLIRGNASGLVLNCLLQRADCTVAIRRIPIGVRRTSSQKPQHCHARSQTNRGTGEEMARCRLHWAKREGRLPTGVKRSHRPSRQRRPGPVRQGRNTSSTNGYSAGISSSLLPPDLRTRPESNILSHPDIRLRKARYLDILILWQFSAAVRVWAYSRIA